MFSLLAQSFSLLLPILLSGLFFILCMRKGWFSFLNRPIDGGKILGGAPIFGVNKNWRGPFIYIVLGTLITLALSAAASSSTLVAPVFAGNGWALGLLLTVSYSGAELVNSFVKRRLGIRPGHDGGMVAKFFDNTDGALASGLVYFAFGAPIQQLLVSFLMSVIVHGSTDLLMRRLRLKQSK